ARYHGHGTRLVLVDVRAVRHDDLLTAPQVHGQRDLVAHRARGHEQRSLEAGHLGDRGFQPVDGGVLPVDVVAHLGLGHRTAHLRRGPGDRVAAEVHRPRGHGRTPLSTGRGDATTATLEVACAVGVTSSSQAPNAAKPFSYICSLRSLRETPLRFGTSGTSPQLAFIGWKPSGFADDRYLTRPP